MCCILCIHYANAAPPVFTSPPSTGGSSSMAETKTGGGVVVSLQANDPDGDSPMFSIASQTPSSPVFTIDGSDQVVVPSGGVDYEATLSFNFIFRVTAGGQTATTTYVLTITDVDDESPVFTNAAYTKTITEAAATGTTLLTVTATDVDSSFISYSISGAQTTFGINAAGVVTVADQAQLTGLKPTEILTLQANDGTNPSGTASLTITILDDSCTSNPCQSGGSCYSSGETTYSCTCTSQYTGPQCQYANLCYISPCQNRATCTPMNNDYICVCTLCFKSKNCTELTDEKFNGRTCHPGEDEEEDKCMCSAPDCNQKDCQRNDPCTSNPCQSGGTCSSSGGTTYSCTCTSQYTGPQCQYARLCYVNPCQNRATCTPMNNDYMCNCTLCFKSKNCTEHTDEKCNGRTCHPGEDEEEDKCICSALDGNQEDCQCKNCHIATICCCLFVACGTVGLIYCRFRYRSWIYGGRYTEMPRTLRKWLSAGCPSENPNSGIPCLETCFRCLDSEKPSICGTVIFMFTMTGLIFLIYISFGLICLIFCCCK